VVVAILSSSDQMPGSMAPPQKYGVVSCAFLALGSATGTVMIPMSKMSKIAATPWKQISVSVFRGGIPMSPRDPRGSSATYGVGAGVFDTTVAP
jgi:hypothetical protein